MQSKICLLVLPMTMISGSAFADSAPGITKVTAESSIQSSGNYKGDVNVVSLDQTLGEKDHLLAYVGRLSRSYNGGASLVDTSFGMGYVVKFSDHVYWENMFVFAPDAQIIPGASIQTRSHYSFGSSDVSVGLTYNNSAVLTSGVISPQYLYQIYDYLAVYGTVFAARAQNNDISYSFGINYTAANRHFFRTNYSFGRTIEDVNLETNFTAFNFAYQYQISKVFKAGPYANYYVSDSRFENSYGLKLEIVP